MPCELRIVVGFELPRDGPDTTGKTMPIMNDANIGARPGTLDIDADAPEPIIRVTQYNADNVEIFDIEDVSTLPGLIKREEVTWVDIQGFGNEKKLRGVAAAFDLHPIALENAVNSRQRPKAEIYDTYQLVITRAPSVDDNGELTVPQVCFIQGEGFLITFQERHLGFFDSVRARIARGGGMLREFGTDYLAYALIDAMIDRYYPVAQRLGDSIEDLEDWVVDNPHPVVLTRIHTIRRQLVLLRRIGYPQREAMHVLLRPQSTFFTEPVKVFARDTYDHANQIVESIDAYREMASDLAESYLSNVSHRSNEIMKVLTLMASIFIPLTFVAGIYGMNFEYIPELKFRNGYFVAWGVMTTLAVGMVFYFRRRGWIGTAAAPPLDVSALHTPDDD